MSNGRLMVIMRGHSGSGKSTKAAEIAKENELSRILSTDSYFTKDGVYTFDAQKLRSNHMYNQDMAREVCASGCPLVIIDNTNMRKWEFEPYLQIARLYDYQVQIVHCVGNYQNVHGVSEEIVAKQLANFEVYP